MNILNTLPPLNSSQSKLQRACKFTGSHSGKATPTTTTRRPTAEQCVCLYHKISTINLSGVNHLAIPELPHTGVNQLSWCLTLVRQCGALADLFGLWLRWGMCVQY